MNCEWRIGTIDDYCKMSLQLRRPRVRYHPIALSHEWEQQIWITHKILIASHWDNALHIEEEHQTPDGLRHSVHVVAVFCTL